MTVSAVSSHQSRAEALAASVERRIRETAPAAGSSLGTLDELRATSGYSKPTVSEAVRLLRDRGLVEIRPGRGGGLFVAPSTPVVRLRRTLLTVGDDTGSATDAIELRDHLEVMIDLAAAGHRSTTDVAQLRAIVRAMGRARDWDAFMRSNWALHRRIAEICPNAMARGVYLGTLGHLSGSTAELADGAEFTAYRARRHGIHADLVEAIASGSRAQVRSAVARHHAAD